MPYQAYQLYELNFGGLICALLARRQKSPQEYASSTTMPSMSTVSSVDDERRTCGRQIWRSFPEQYIAMPVRAQGRSTGLTKLIDIADGATQDIAVRIGRRQWQCVSKAFIVKTTFVFRSCVTHARMWVRPRSWAEEIRRQRSNRQGRTGKDGGPVELTDAKAALLRGAVPKRCR